MKIWITTNGRASDSATILSKAEGFGRAKLGGSIKPGDLVVNWGSGNGLGFEPKPEVKVLNKPEAVARASNKLLAFKYFLDAQVATPEWTNEKAKAIAWDATFFARTKLTGHSGEGIVIVPKGEIDNVVDAPLYTRYIFKEREYRVHVMGDTIIDTQRKIRDPAKEVVSWKIRSHENGFIFARNNIKEDIFRNDIARRAIKALGLDFGAVDIIQDKEDNYYVLEVNTAPGLEGTSIDIYTEAFKNV